MRVSGIVLRAMLALVVPAQVMAKSGSIIVRPKVVAGAPGEQPTRSPVANYYPFSLGAGEWIDLTVTVRTDEAVIAIIGPVGQYPSQLQEDNVAFVEGAEAENRYYSVLMHKDVAPAYHWGKAGNLLDWIADAASSGVGKGVEQAVKAASPEILQVAYKGYKVLAGATRKGGLEQFTADEVAMALVEATGVGYKAKVLAAFVWGGIVGAANSSRGEVGIVCFKVNTNVNALGRPFSVGDADPNEPHIAFRINSPLWHPYGDYTVITLAAGDDPLGFSTWDALKEVNGLSSQTAIPAIVETGTRSFSAE